MPAPSRRLLLLGLVAVATLLAAEGTARAIGGTGPPSLLWHDRATQLKVSQMEALACADLVVVGSSMARDGFDPPLFAEATDLVPYNASLDAASPALLRRWLEDAVLPTLAPQTVLVVLGTPELNANSSAAAAAVAAYDASVMGRQDPWGRLGAWAAERSALVRNRVWLREPSEVAGALSRLIRGEQAPSLEEDLRATIGESGEGLSRRELRHDGDPAAAAFARTQLLGDHQISPDRLRDVEELLASVRRAGAEPVLVMLPVTGDFAALHPRDRLDLEEAAAALAEISERTATPFVDLVDAGYPDAAFADTHHLNGQGAARLTEELAERLDRLLPDAQCPR